MATLIPAKLPVKFSVKEYCHKRNQVLIYRNMGGLGDILMMRMIFEDLKHQIPDAYIIAACPSKYLDALRYHPFIDEVRDVAEVNVDDFVLSYNLTHVCDKHERRMAPFANEHRSDIWAAHCGIKLTRHEMHLHVPKKVEDECRSALERHRINGQSPIILFSPVSAISSKDLDKNQSNQIIAHLTMQGNTVVCLHHRDLSLDAPTIIAPSVIDFLGFIKAADYIISVDTSTFHAAGGLRKPQVSIFSWADGKVYGKWFDKNILVQKHRDNGDWPCGPCFTWQYCPRETTNRRKPCITEISVTEVLSAVSEMLERWPLKSEGKECQDGLKNQ